MKYYLFWWNLIQYCLCVHSAPCKKLCSCIFYVSIDHLKYLIILSLEKEIIVVEKSVENYKSWILDPKIWTDPVRILQVKFYFRFILIKPRLILNFHWLSPSPRRPRKLRINLGWKILTLNQIWPVTYTLKAALMKPGSNKICYCIPNLCH